MNYLIALPLISPGRLAIYSLMAFALARMRWRGRGVIAVLFLLIIAGQFWMVPTLVPNLKDATPVSYVIWFGNLLVSSFSVVILCQGVATDSERLGGFSAPGRVSLVRPSRHIVLPFVRREIALIALLTAMATAPLFWATGFTPTTIRLSLLLPLRTLSGNGPRHCCRRSRQFSGPDPAVNFDLRCRKTLVSAK